MENTDILENYNNCINQIESHMYKGKGKYYYQGFCHGNYKRKTCNLFFLQSNFKISQSIKL